MDWADRIGRRIKLRDLHVLMAVADAGSMAKASARLAVSHPVISKTISDLEQALGVRLLDRSSQGVELTSYGRALLNCGINVFDEMRQGLRQIEFLSDPRSGEVRIGCTEITMAGLVPAIAEEFSKRHPGIRLEVVLANPAVPQFPDLRERKVDLLLLRATGPLMEDDLYAEKLFDEPFAAVAGARSRWARKHRIALTDIVGEPWVLPPYDSVPGALIREIFRTRDLPPPRARIVTLSGQLTVTLIAGGRFVGLLPMSVAQFSADRRGVRILPLQFPTPRFAVAIITVKKRTLSPFAELFIACARESAKLLAARADAHLA
jgi:DNA-binding transcriptional LysR family regulator